MNYEQSCYQFRDKQTPTRLVPNIPPYHNKSKWSWKETDILIVIGISALMTDIRYPVGIDNFISALRRSGQVTLAHYLRLSQDVQTQLAG